jgi:hypothetical protein
MRQIVTALLLAGSVAPAFGFQTGGARGAAGGAAVKACAILTREMVLPFAANPKVLDLISPEEEPMSGGGAACEYGIVRLQVTPGGGAKRIAPSKEWQPVSGAGEIAFFRSNPNGYAELMFWTATHYLTLQVSVPTGGTAEGLKPRVLTLANQVIAKLRQ